MSSYKIGIIVGSLRKDSFNRQLAHAVSKMLPETFQPEFIEIGNLPLYNQDNDNATPANVVAFKNTLAQMHGIIFVTAEYNRSIPGVLKNALDQGSRPYGSSVWQDKPAGILGISPGTIGTSLAQQHLRNVLAFLAMPTLTQPEMFLQYKEGLFDHESNVINVDTKAFIQRWVDAYVQWVKNFS